MYNAFREMLVRLIADMIAWVTDMSSWLMETSLKVESAMWISDNPLTQALISSIYHYIYGAVLTLVALKFIWKGFQVYILWRDGDSEVSPHNLLTGACLAIVISLAFPTIYNVGVTATVDIGNGIVDKINEYWIGKPDIYSYDNTEEATAIWNKWFAPFDENGDGELSRQEHVQFSEWIDKEKLYSALYEDYPEYSASGSAWLWNEISIKSIMEDLDETSVELLASTLENLNLAGVLALLIYFILYVILYIQLLGRGVEMLFLRWGFPIASIGLINSDGGIFPSYAQLILRQMATSILQVAAMYLSFYIAMDFRLSHVLMGLAVIGVALKGPLLMAQIIAPQKQGGGFGPKLHTALMLRQLLHR